MESYILIAIISMVLFGVNAIVIKSAKNIDPITLSVVSLGTAFCLALVYWFFFYHKKEFGNDGLAVGAASGVIYFFALILFIVALQKGKASVVVTINALSAGVAALLAIFFLSEKITILKLTGIVLGIIAVILLSL